MPMCLIIIWPKFLSISLGSNVKVKVKTKKKTSYEFLRFTVQSSTSEYEAAVLNSVRTGRQDGRTDRQSDIMAYRNSSVLLKRL